MEILLTCLFVFGINFTVQTTIGYCIYKIDDIRSKKILKKKIIKERKKIVSNKICVICQDDYKKEKCYKLYCNHEYHKKCIMEWIKVKPKCPLCNDYLTTNLNKKIRKHEINF